jgi:hypothetical protein
MESFSMNEFFAADPASCDNSSDLRFLLGNFGPQTGRYLAEYPISWADDVVKHCEQLGQVEAERLKLLVRRSYERAALLRKNALPWDTKSDWVRNYRILAQQLPREFANAIVARVAKSEGLLTIDDLDLSPTADESIDAVAKEYVRVSKTLLLLSPELIFVDPYLNPCKNDRRDVLVAMFAVAAKGKCRKITCWARGSEVMGERRNSWEEVGSAIEHILQDAGWQGNREFQYNFVDDATTRSKMHARYMLSIKGGIRYDQGFQRLTRGRRNDVSPIGTQLHVELIKTYHEGAHDMRIEHVFEFATSRK